VSTYPLDLVRSRLSIVSASLGIGREATAALASSGAQVGIVGMTVKVYREEGGIR
jgi:solute carrier family 25 phosphate transporter 23/24/25/41